MKTENEPQLSAEQAADLAALTAAAEADAPAALADETPAAPQIDPAEQWAIIPAMIGSALQISMPELGKVYTPEACRNWGAAMVPVADKYGWSADVLGGPELGLVAASFPLLLGTVAAVNARKAQIAAAAHKPAGAVVDSVTPPASAEPAAPSSKAVQFGTVQP